MDLDRTNRRKEVLGLMAYTLQDIVRISGVRLETLQEFLQQGLLHGSQKKEDGEELYGEEQLLRLQFILFNLEQDVPMEEMAHHLEEQEKDPIATLVSHKQCFIEKVLRIQTIVDTIDLTTSYLKNGEKLDFERLYIGLSSEDHGEACGDSGAPEEAELSRQGQEDEDPSRWSKEDYLSTQKEADGIYLDLCRAMESGLTPNHPEVQSIIHRHYKWVCNFYTPSQKIYSDLGELYVEQDDFKKLYDVYHPGLAEYLRDAMKIFADKQL
ncbi:MerR family transcriptional regulator [Paenibacillus lemnae]|uniref:MerR family transcriptional regulator n=1 Tax=Paenibacillus lemnae TaxID=1330551 RepID=A0A848MAT2_PAELE|nr:TipAS antibiotic-recognition domain-containing protein [Paenibacillus lemnae]NMO97369.1 MerR family transcriptional regulator [Paenibacillus lemnae]